MYLEIEIPTVDGEKLRVHLARNCAGDKGLARAGRAVEQNLSAGADVVLLGEFGLLHGDSTLKVICSLTSPNPATSAKVILSDAPDGCTGVNEGFSSAFGRSFSFPAALVTGFCRSIPFLRSRGSSPPACDIPF